MADEVVEDLAEDLRTRVHRDPHVLHKNAGLFESIVLAYIEQGLDWDRCRDVLRETKLIRTWEKRIKAAAHKAQGIPQIADEGPDLPSVVDVWAGAPVSSEAEIPRGWGANDPGAAIYQEVERTVDGLTMTKRVPVSYDPIVIRRRIRHEEQRSVMLELAWRTGKRWHLGVYDRDEVFKKNGLVAAAADGAPVRDDNAMEIVKFLGAYEHHNLNHLGHGYASSSMGWKGSTDQPTADGFLCGYKHMCKDEDARSFVLRPMGPGDEEQAKTVRIGGTFEAWKQAVVKCGKFPAVRVAFYAGLASVMLPILGAPNTIIEFVKGTSTGKTRVLEAVQSLWRSSRSALVSWDNTNSNFESKAHLFSGLPLFMDDTKAVTTGQGKLGQEILGKNIYKFVNGVGRGRDQRSGGQRSSITWSGVLFSTGEIPSSDLVHAEGAAARVLSFWTAPWGKRSDDTGAMLDRLIEIELAENYGHAGPAFIQWLHTNRQLWPQFCQAYEEATRNIRNRFKSRAADRLARVIALFEVTAIAAHLADVIPWPARSILDDAEIQSLLQISVRQAEVGADDAARAWDYLLSYAESRRSQWVPWGMEPNLNSEPSSGWLGWRSDEHLGWNPDRLKQALESGGFTNDVILRVFLERGMIEAGSGRSRYGKNARIGTELTKRTVRLVWMKLDEATWVSDGDLPSGDHDADDE